MHYAHGRKLNFDSYLTLYKNCMTDRNTKIKILKENTEDHLEGYKAGGNNTYV